MNQHVGIRREFQGTTRSVAQILRSIVLVAGRLQASLKGKMMGPPGADMLWAAANRRGPRTFGGAGLCFGGPVPDELPRADGGAAVIETQKYYACLGYLHLILAYRALANRKGLIVLAYS